LQNATQSILKNDQPSGNFSDIRSSRGLAAKQRSWRIRSHDNIRPKQSKKKKKMARLFVSGEDCRVFCFFPKCLNQHLNQLDILTAHQESLAIGEIRFFPKKPCNADLCNKLLFFFSNSKDSSKAFGTLETPHSHSQHH
jgi:hypothetical protein